MRPLTRSQGSRMSLCQRSSGVRCTPQMGLIRMIPMVHRHAAEVVGVDVC